MKRSIKAMLVCLVAGTMTFGGYYGGYVMCRDKMQEDIDREREMLLDARNTAAEMQDAYGIVKALYDDMNIVTSDIANLISHAETMQIICNDTESLKSHADVYKNLKSAIADWQAAIFSTEHPIDSVFTTDEEKMDKIQDLKETYALNGLQGVLTYAKYVYDVSEALIFDKSTDGAKELQAQQCKTMAYNMVSEIRGLITQSYSNDRAILDAIPELLKSLLKVDEAFYTLMMM